MFDVLIGMYPDQGKLFLKRGQWRGANRDWEAALEDYARAERLNPTLAGLDLFKGLALMQGHRWDSARAALDRFVSKEPDHVLARLSRARIFMELGQPMAAVDDYTHAIERSAEPRPEYYIDRARALAGQGRTTLALRGLDEGIRKLGSIATLELMAIDLELANHHYDQALARLDKLATQGERPEIWLARRGDILERAARREEARAAYQAAWTAIESVPPSRRRVRATVDLENQLQSALERLGGENTHDHK
jgi:tetratricopeptide (TPR) repeat protein